MNFKEKRGSIAIFVLVALLFMAAFLIISYAQSLNELKVVKEQFDIASKIYVGEENLEDSYVSAYVALKKVKQISINNEDIVPTEQTNKLELINTFKSNLVNYKIYGNTISLQEEEGIYDIQSLGENFSRLEKIQNTGQSSFGNVNDIYTDYQGNIFTGTENRNKIIDFTYMYIADYPIGTKFYCSQIISNATERAYNNQETIVTMNVDEDGNKINEKDSNVIILQPININTNNFSQFPEWEHIWTRFYINGKNESYCTKNSEKLKYIRYLQRTYSVVNNKNAISTHKMIKIESIPEGSNVKKCRIPVKLTNENGISNMVYIYLDEPLRKVENYVDYIDYKNGKIMKNVEKIDNYNYETITTAWISNTGLLSKGSTVYYRIREHSRNRYRFT